MSIKTAIFEASSPCHLPLKTPVYRIETLIQADLTIDA